MERKLADDWAAAVGGIALTLLLIAIGLNVAFGLEWFSQFLAGSASGWVQAVGSIGAIFTTSSS